MIWHYVFRQIFIKTYSNLNNLELLGRQELYYSYMGFKVGRFDKTKGENIVNPNAKMAEHKIKTGSGLWT